MIGICGIRGNHILVAMSRNVNQNKTFTNANILVTNTKGNVFELKRLHKNLSTP